ncbi:MAG: hypothetical protein AAF840_06605 [Bacteroidota bacterium]
MKSSYEFISVDEAQALDTLTQQLTTNLKCIEMKMDFGSGRVTLTGVYCGEQITVSATHIDLAMQGYYEQQAVIRQRILRKIEPANAA